MSTAQKGHFNTLNNVITKDIKLQVENLSHRATARHVAQLDHFNTLHKLLSQCDRTAMLPFIQGGCPIKEYTIEGQEVSAPTSWGECKDSEPWSKVWSCMWDKEADCLKMPKDLMISKQIDCVQHWLTGIGKDEKCSSEGHLCTNVIIPTSSNIYTVSDTECDDEHSMLCRHVWTTDRLKSAFQIYDYTTFNVCSKSPETMTGGMTNELCNEYTKWAGSAPCPRESGCVLLPPNWNWATNLINSKIIEIEIQPTKRADREIEKSVRNGKLFMDPLLAIDNKLDQIRNRQEEIFIANYTVDTRGRVGT